MKVGGSGSMGGRNGYEIEYDYYDSKGHKTGTVLLTEEMYNAEHWVLFTDENDNIYYYSNSTGNFYFTYFTDTYNYILFSNKSGSWETNTYYKYNKTTDTFSSSVCKKYSFYTNWNPISTFNPSGIIKTKSMSVFYYAGGAYEYYLYTPLIDFPSISNMRDVSLGDYEYIDICLNDCFDYGVIESTLKNDTVSVKTTFDVNNFFIKFSDVESGNSLLYKQYYLIDNTNSYFVEIDGLYYLRIPRSEVYEDILEKNKQYNIQLSFDFSVTTNLDNKFYAFTQKYVNEVNYDFTYGTVWIDPDNPVEPEPDNPNKPVIDGIKDTTDAIKEQTEVSKNIFEKIGDILSYINPFSENFFVYKLIELLINALKSLFIPSDTFFNTFFSDLNDWFSDRFGFLYYPLELFFDLCNRFINIDFAEPIINIPDIVEPTTNLVLIHSTQYNFNSLLENDVLKTVHDIYFIIVDAVIYIGLALLLYNKYEEVMTK